MVRSSNWKVIFNDIEETLERATIDVIEEINTIAKDKTPIGDTRKAYDGWRTVGKYKLGASMNVIHNKTPYIKILDDGRSFRDGQMRGSVYAKDGMINPKLNNTIKDITNRRRKL